MGIGCKRLSPAFLPPLVRLFMFCSLRLKRFSRDRPCLNHGQTSDNAGPHATFIVHTEVEATREAWETPRRYRDFTQLRKRLLRLGVDIPKAAASRGGEGGRTGSLAPDLPKKTWRANKFDKDHLDTRRVALEGYLKAAVEVGMIVQEKYRFSLTGVQSSCERIGRYAEKT